MEDLKELKCVPCRGGVPPLDDLQIAIFKPQTPEWQVIEVEGIKRLQRSFKFKNFAEALAFTDQVGACWRRPEDHHPTLVTEWGNVTVTWWTHKIKGLHQNDFIMAAKTDALLLEPSRQRSLLPGSDQVAGFCFASVAMGAKVVNKHTARMDPVWHYPRMCTQQTTIWSGS